MKPDKEIFKEIMWGLENTSIEDLKADLLKHSGGSVGRCFEKGFFEQQYLCTPTFDYPTLEELDKMIAEVESMIGEDGMLLSRWEKNLRTRELRKIRKEKYSGDRRY